MNSNDKPKCIIVVGAPASAKSTFLKRYHDYQRCSFDDKRFKVLDSKNSGVYYDPAIEKEIHDYVYAKFRLHIVKKENVVFDATSMTREKRDKIFKLISSDYHVNVFVMPQDLQWCLKNNKKRDRFVPEQIIKEIFYSYEPVVNLENRYGFSFNIFYLDKSDF